VWRAMYEYVNLPFLFLLLSFEADLFFTCRPLELLHGRIAYGGMNPEVDHSWEDLGVKATSLSDWIERTGFRGLA
jgi:hypothetical protein